MHEDRLELTFVLPVYNGGRFLDATLRDAWAWLSSRGLTFELLVVDDGSVDATAEILRRFAAQTPPLPNARFVALRNAQNRGKGFSLRRAFLAARGERIVFTDADLTYAMPNVESVLRALADGAQVACGSRMHADSRYVIAPTFFPKLYTRHLMGRVFNLLVRAVVVPGIRDTQAGLKGFSREAARELAARVRLDRFSFDVEMLFVARRLGLRIAECPVEFVYRKEPSTVRFVADSLRMARDMLLVRWRGWRHQYDVPDAALLAELATEASPATPHVAPTAIAPSADRSSRSTG